MVKSETRKNIIKLGKSLVELLGDEQKHDVLSRWMSFYIAEQMTLAEESSGRRKRVFEKRCFDAILALWEKRGNFPRGVRPFEDFEGVLRALALLDLESQRSYYFPLNRRQKLSDSNREKAAQELLEFATSIDQVARALIEAGLAEAIKKATTRKSKALLKTAYAAVPSTDLEVIIRLKTVGLSEADFTDDARTKKIAYLSRRVEILDSFAQICQKIRPAFLQELERVQRKPRRRLHKKARVKEI